MPTFDVTFTCGSVVLKSNYQIIYLSQATWPIHRHSHTRTQYTIIQKKENKKKLK